MLDGQEAIVSAREGSLGVAIVESRITVPLGGGRAFVFGMLPLFGDPAASLGAGASAEGMLAATAGSVTTLADQVADRVVERLLATGTAPAVGTRTASPTPTGMTAWVRPRDVQSTLGCSRSQANAYLRAAAGRAAGSGHLLLVPVDVWEAWARDNLVDGRKSLGGSRERRAHARTAASGLASSRRAASSDSGEKSSAEAPVRPIRKRLAPDSTCESVRPLIPRLKRPKP
jgi:hypothetical protein